MTSNADLETIIPPSVLAEWKAQRDADLRREAAEVAQREARERAAKAAAVELARIAKEWPDAARRYRDAVATMFELGPLLDAMTGDAVRATSAIRAVGQEPAHAVPPYIGVSALTPQALVELDRAITRTAKR